MCSSAWSTPIVTKPRTPSSSRAIFKVPAMASSGGMLPSLATAEVAAPGGIRTGWVVVSDHRGAHHAGVPGRDQGSRHYGELRVIPPTCSATTERGDHHPFNDLSKACRV